MSEIETGVIPSVGAIRAARLRREEAWKQLRAAIAEDLIGKLPESIPLTRIPSLLHVPGTEVRRAVADGAIAVARVGGVRCMITSQSREFLASESRIRLPLPEHLNPRRREISYTIGVTIDQDAHAALARASRERGLSLQQLVCEIVETGAARA